MQWCTEDFKCLVQIFQTSLPFATNSNSCLCFTLLQVVVHFNVFFHYFLAVNPSRREQNPEFHEQYLQKVKANCLFMLTSAKDYPRITWQELENRRNGRKARNTLSNFYMKECPISKSCQFFKYSLGYLHVYFPI